LCLGIGARVVRAQWTIYCRDGGADSCSIPELTHPAGPDYQFSLQPNLYFWHRWFTTPGHLLAHTTEHRRSYYVSAIASDVESEPMSTRSRILRLSLVCSRRQYRFYCLTHRILRPPLPVRPVSSSVPVTLKPDATNEPTILLPGTYE
jgi:hypothetical protein